MLNEWLLGIGTAVISLWLGSVEIRMRHQEARLRDAPSRKEMKEDIAIHLEVVKVLQKELKEDIREMRKQLEQIANTQK